MNAQQQQQQQQQPQSMNAVQVLNQFLQGFSEIYKDVVQAGEYGQFWSGSQPVGSGASNVTLTLQRREFDYNIRKIAVRCINSTTFTEQVGMTVQIIVGSLVLYPTAVDVKLFDPLGGTFVDQLKPIFADKADDIKFVFTNRLATAAICDVLLWGTRS